VTMAYQGPSSGVTLTFWDNLGNKPVTVTSQCLGTSPKDICTGIGYYVVTKGGLVDISMKAVGATSGRLSYMISDWRGNFHGQITAQGADGACISDCSNSIQTSSVLLRHAQSAIAVSIAGAYYSGTSSWNATLPFYFYSNTQGGGYSFLWQASNFIKGPQDFSASTSSPLIWAESGEVLT
jgi:hypothetical protein